MTPKQQLFADLKEVGEWAWTEGATTINNGGTPAEMDEALTLMETGMSLLRHRMDLALAVARKRADRLSKL